MAISSFKLVCNSFFLVNCKGGILVFEPKG